MKYDVWFTKYNNALYVVSCIHDEPPNTPPVKIRNPRTALAAYRRGGMKIVQVGIVPPDALGLE
jgi:hypothetical protein